MFFNFVVNRTNIILLAKLQVISTKMLISKKKLNRSTKMFISKNK